MKELEVVNEGAMATVLLNYAQDHHRISFIKSTNPGYGEAAVLLARICEWADLCCVTLSLLPVADSGIPLKKLREWYGRNGFVDYDGGMIRVPVT